MLPLNILYGVDFIWGSVFSLLVLRLIGPVPAVFTSLIASSYTFIIWGHPYAAVIFTFEIIFIAVASRLKQSIRSYTALSAFYWVLAGMWFVYLFYGIVMAMGISQVLVIVGKQSLNGVMNALIAEILIQIIFYFRSRNPLDLTVSRSFLSIQHFLINLMVGLVIFPLVIFLLLYSRNEMERLTESSLRELRFQADSLHESFVGRNSSEISEILRNMPERSTVGILLFDKENNLIYNGIKDPFYSWIGADWKDSAVPAGERVYHVFSPDDRLTMKKFAGSVYVCEDPPEPGHEFKIVTVKFLKYYVDSLQQIQAKSMITVMVILAIAIIFVIYISRKLTEPINRIADLSTNLPDKLLQNAVISWPESAFTEISRLSGNFMEMSRELRRKIKEIREINQTLEDKVEERTRSLQEQILIRKQAESELHTLNLSLEARVIQETSKRREQEQILIHQSRLAAMGEMLDAIAHQWRQPLNTVAVLLQNLEEDASEGKADYAVIRKSVTSSLEQIQYLSSIIETFRSMNTRNPGKEDMDLKTVLNDIYGLYEGQLRESGIELQLDLSKADENTPSLIKGYSSYLKQIIINIINNSREAVLSKHIQNGWIKAELIKENSGYCIRISDNGGGVPEEIKDRIFDPYFSTKRTGSGIGLYMSKVIVENTMNGRISFHNEGPGAVFCILI